MGRHKSPLPHHCTRDYSHTPDRIILNNPDGPIETGFPSPKAAWLRAIELGLDTAERAHELGIDLGSAKKRPKSSPAHVRQQESPPSPQSNDRGQRRHLAAREERRNSSPSEIDMTGTDDESVSGSQPVGLSSVQNGVLPLFVGGGLAADADLSAAGADSFDDNSSCTGSVAASGSSVTSSCMLPSAFSEWQMG